MFILETSACTNASVLATILFIKRIVKILSIIVPAVLVALLTIDIGKAVLESDEEGLRKAQKLSVKRIVYAIIVFFVPIIVDATFNLLSGTKLVGTACYTNATEENIEKLVKAEKDKKAVKQAEKDKAIEEAKKAREKAKKQTEKDRKKAIDQAKQNVNNKANNDNVTSTNHSYNGKAKLSKSYSSIKVLDTLKKSDFEKKQTVKTSLGRVTAQSFTVVGNNYVVGFINYSNTQTAIGVYNKSTAKRVNHFTGFSFGHTNGMGYNVKSGNIYVTHGLLSRSKVHMFKASGIESRKSIGASSFNAPISVSGIGYDRVTGKLYYASGDGIYRYSNGKTTKVVNRKNFVFGMSQDICVHNDIIYDLRISGGNALDIHTTSGKYLGTYKFNVGNEVESIDYYGEGEKMALLFHNSGGSTNHYIYVIDTIMPH